MLNLNDVYRNFVFFVAVLERRNVRVVAMHVLVWMLYGMLEDCRVLVLLWLLRLRRRNGFVVNDVPTG